MTIADQLEATGGRPTGFDYLRIVLAISILAWHTIQTCYGFAESVRIYMNGWRPVIGLILPMFFALSGFLVAGSLARTPALSKFLGLRALRIYPALAAETLFSAFVIGPILTKTPLAAYFKAREFRQYLYNIFGIIHYKLPGLFCFNPEPRIVNLQLWTVPFELQCYLLLAAFALCGVAYRSRLILVVSTALHVAVLIANEIPFHEHLAISKTPVTGGSLVMVFLAGVAFFVLRRKILLNRWIFFASLIFSFIALAVPLGDYFLSYPVAYVTIYLGLKNPPANAFYRLGDCSYGIFLYGFPIQQVVASWGSWARHWYISYPMSLCLTVFAASLSWRFIEKPALTLKRYLSLLSPLDSGIERMKQWARSGRACVFR